MTTAAWTDEKVERMTTLWLEGLSAATIALKLGDGVTRSAVLGKILRLVVRRPAAFRPRRSAPPATGRRTRLERPSASQGPRPVPSAEAESPLATLLSVRRGCCRWPYGDPGGGDMPVCGRAVSRGSYCASHAAVSYQDRRRISLLALAGLSEG